MRGKFLKAMPLACSEDSEAVILHVYPRELEPSHLAMEPLRFGEAGQNW